MNKKAGLWARPFVCSSTPSASHHVAGLVAGIFLVPALFHPALGAVGGELLLELLAQIRIFHVIGDGGAALVHVDGAVIQQRLARDAGLARALVVRAVPGGDAQRIVDCLYLAEALSYRAMRMRSDG